MPERHCEGNAMTEPGPFTPPVPPPPVAPPPQARPPLPPPTGAPIGVAAPPVAPPSPPRGRRWLVPVIIGGSLLLVALIAGVTVVAVQLATWVSEVPAANDPGGGTALDDLLEGDPGSPVAVEPLDCTVCFQITEARTLTLPDEAYVAVGLPNGDNEEYQLVAGDDQVETSKAWRTDGGTPDHCYFSYATAPLFFAPGDPGDSAAERDIIYYPEWHFDEMEYYAFTAGVRVFDETASATAHLAQLESAIAGCASYSYSETGWSAVVTATPALDLPDSVAAYGWAESAGLSRYYGVDLQRGNLVVRLALNSDPDGPSEADFRQLVEAYAVLLAELEPTG